MKLFFLFDVYFSFSQKLQLLLIESNFLCFGIDWTFVHSRLGVFKLSLRLRLCISLSSKWCLRCCNCWRRSIDLELELNGWLYKVSDLSKIESVFVDSQVLALEPMLFLQWILNFISQVARNQQTIYCSLQFVPFLSTPHRRLSTKQRKWNNQN